MEKAVPAEIVTFKVQPSLIELDLPADSTCRDLYHKLRQKYGCGFNNFCDGSQLLLLDARLPTDSSKVLGADLEPSIILTVIDEDGRQEKYIMAGHVLIEKMMRRHCNDRSLNPEEVRFVYNEVDLQPQQTVQSLGMKHADVIYMIYETPVKSSGK